tara:strand:- start:1902 stop:2735 length:834 start_codon:yes stop_codon:yes gene_type:complete
LKKVFKKKIVITGATGLLGSYFFRKYKHRYNIIKYPFRIENVLQLNKWMNKKDFDFFVHFASKTKEGKDKENKELEKINVKSTINIINVINKKKIKNFKYFLFISTSHVYGFSKKSINEKKLRYPKNDYGLSKKRVEDFILRNKKKFFFKIGIARVFNFTGAKQKRGFIIPDIFEKIRKNSIIKDMNQYRDFIHIDDVTKSINLILNKQYDNPINISSGKKINLINVCKIINKIHFKKKLLFEKKRGGDIFGNNSLLKRLGIKKFKNINQSISSYKK